MRVPNTIPQLLKVSKKMKNFSKQGLSMPLSKELKSTVSERDLELVRKDKEGHLIVKDRQTGNVCTIIDTYADTCTRLVKKHSGMEGAHLPFFSL